MKKCYKCDEEVEYEVFDICKNCYFETKEKFYCEICGVEVTGKEYFFNSNMCKKCSG